MDARSVLRPVLRVFQLRRVMVSEVELPRKEIVQVSALMPAFTITTVELEISKTQAVDYYQVHHDCAEFLNLGFDEESQQGRIDPIRHRRL